MGHLFTSQHIRSSRTTKASLWIWDIGACPISQHIWSSRNTEASLWIWDIGACPVSQHIGSHAWKPTLRWSSVLDQYTYTYIYTYTSIIHTSLHTCNIQYWFVFIYFVGFVYLTYLIDFINFIVFTESTSTSSYSFTAFLGAQRIFTTLRSSRAPLSTRELLQRHV